MEESRGERERVGEEEEDEGGGKVSGGGRVGVVWRYGREIEEEIESCCFSFSSSSSCSSFPLLGNKLREEGGAEEEWIEKERHFWRTSEH